MRKLGKFKGLPVYALVESEWQTMTTKDNEAFYVVNSNVYYHDVKVARLNEYGQLAGLDEDEIVSLRKRYDAMREEKSAEARSVAEFRSAAEEVRVHCENAEVSPTVAGSAQPQPQDREEFDIDKFLKEGLFDVDGYIKNMLAADLSVEVEDVAVG